MMPTTTLALRHRGSRMAAGIGLLALVAAGHFLSSPTAGAQEPAPPPDLDVPYVPTPPEVVKVMLALAKVQRSDTVYDLGSGDGRLVVTAAERFGARGLGVDIDPARVAEARANARKARVTGKVEFKQADLFDLDLRPATVLTMYLLPDVNLRLRPRILEQLRPGSRVVSHDFDMAEWEPDVQRTVGEHRVYLWIVPAQVSGPWSFTVALPSGPREYLLHLEQRFQQIEGRVADASPGATAAGGRTIPVTEAKLAGDQISFKLRDPAAAEGRPVLMHYQGTVANGGISGAVTLVEGATSSQVPWKARPASL